MRFSCRGHFRWCCSRRAPSAGRGQHIGDAHFGAIGFRCGGGSGRFGGRRGGWRLCRWGGACFICTGGGEDVGDRLLGGAFGPGRRGYLAGGFFGGGGGVGGGFFGFGLGRFRGRFVDDFEEFRCNIVPADIQMKVVELDQCPAVHVDGFHAANHIAETGQFGPRCVYQDVLVRIVALHLFDLLGKHRGFDLLNCCRPFSPKSHSASRTYRSRIRDMGRGDRSLTGPASDILHRRLVARGRGAIHNHVSHMFIAHAPGIHQRCSKIQLPSPSPSRAEHC